MRSFFLLALLLATAAHTHAQSVARRVALGATVSAPVGSMADAYDVGVGGRATLDLRPSSAFGWQIGVEATRFGGRERRFGSTPFRDGLSLGATVSARLRLQAGPTTVHALGGVGAFRERAGDHAPYAVVPEVHVGAGLAVAAGNVEIVPEVGLQVVLSDLLSGSEYAPSIRVPVTVGVRF